MYEMNTTRICGENNVNPLFLLSYLNTDKYIEKGE